MIYIYFLLDRIKYHYFYTYTTFLLNKRDIFDELYKYIYFSMLYLILSFVSLSLHPQVLELCVVQSWCFLYMKYVFGSSPLFLIT